MHPNARYVPWLGVTAAALLAACAARGSAHGGSASGRELATVTYVGNSGFLIHAGGRKLLIDAAIDGFPGRYVVPASVQEPLLAGRPPFDGIDLVLVTHRHGDHFGATAVRRVLENNPSAVLVAPADVVAALPGMEGRATALEVPEGQRRTLEVGGFSVAAMPLSHGQPPAGRPGIVNLAYLVAVGGTKFFHAGDIDVDAVPISLLRSLGLPDERIDAAFVPHFLLSTPAPIPWVTDGLRPRFVVASHLQFTGEPVNAPQIRRNFPSAVVLMTEGESWAVP